MSTVRATRARPPRGVWLLGLLTGVLLGLIAAPAALADTAQSSNWAGYAVHRNGVHFTKVLGVWRQPTATCAAGGPTFSSVWVGLGGFALNSSALEQIGSEVDCSPTGQVVSSAWYELVPAPSRPIRMTVNPGDLMRASVIVVRHEVTLTLRDLTRHREFRRRLYVHQIDNTSAEWIVEAPSECSSQTSCQTLNLADFGTTGFTSAQATMTTRHVGSITDRHWGITRIILASGQRHFVGGSGSGPQATPSPLTAGGSAFSVSYQPASGSSSSSANTTHQARVSARQRLALGGIRRTR